MLGDTDAGMLAALYGYSAISVQEPYVKDSAYHSPLDTSDKVLMNCVANTAQWILNAIEERAGLRKTIGEPAHSLKVVEGRAAPPPSGYASKNDLEKVLGRFLSEAHRR